MLARRLTLAALLLFLVLPLYLVNACGPFFEPEVFVPTNHPAAPPHFAEGRLGVLQPTYYIAEKVAAFRYLNGGTLSPAEQKQWLALSQPASDDFPDELVPSAAPPPPNQPAAATRWLQARAAAIPSLPAPTYLQDITDPTTTTYQQIKSIQPDLHLTLKANNFNQTVDILNCPDPAFLTAIRTLAARQKTWATTNPAALKDWLTAQDAVFSNCAAAGTLPAAAPASSPALLQQDRAYQHAAALFYQQHYPQAAQAFAAIAADKPSPWQPWGTYLQARALIRQSFFAAPLTDQYSGDLATFDRPTMQRAADTLAAALHATTDPALQHSIRDLQNLVAARLTPSAQASRLATTLAGPATDPDFGQNLVDLRFLLDHGQTGTAPLLTFMQATGTTFGQNLSADQKDNTPKPPTPAQLLATWHQSPSLPNLIAALMAAPAPDPTLQQAAAVVPQTSPAFVTAQYHRARLLLLAHDLPAARTLLTTTLALTRQRNEIAATNALLALRLPTATSLPELLTDAPRTTLTEGSSSYGLAHCANETDPKACPPLPKLQFDSDGAILFNTRLPLSLWVESAHSPDLPQNLRDAVADAAWIRALVLADNDPAAGTTATSLIPLLPTPIRNVLSKATDPNGFATTLVLLHSPGLRPYLEQGIQRSVSYNVQDSFRDNFWCNTSSTAVTRPDPADTIPSPIPAADPTFLTPGQRSATTSELATLNTQPAGIVWLGRRTIDFIKAHPDHPIAAEALALLVKDTHYTCEGLALGPNGQYDDALQKQQSANRTAISREAFTLLHTRYPNSPWTAKTPYYY